MCTRLSNMNSEDDQTDGVLCSKVQPPSLHLELDLESNLWTMIPNVPILRNWRVAPSREIKEMRPFLVSLLYTRRMNYSDKHAHSFSSFEGTCTPTSTILGAQGTYWWYSGTYAYSKHCLCFYQVAIPQELLKVVYLYQMDIPHGVPY
jgi:hypothetical protein